MKRILNVITSLRSVTTTSAGGGAGSQEIKGSKNIVASRAGIISGNLSSNVNISHNVTPSAPRPPQYYVPKSTTTNTNLSRNHSKLQPREILNEKAQVDEELLDDKRRRGFYYNSLLNSVVDVILSEANNTDKLERREWLTNELSVKRIINTNEEMKKIILKMANTVANQVDGNDATKFIHPFIPTAGEVFFGASPTNDDTLPQYIQDILTPGLLVLIMDKILISPESSFLPQNDTRANGMSDQLAEKNGVSPRHVLLAKALVETCAGYLIHRTIQETNHLNQEENEHLASALDQGNKLATLMGDLLVVSLIKNVATTRCNKVLELTMNSLSEFSTTEVAKSLRPFKQLSAHTYKALLPKTLAESSVFSKGFQSSVLLSGVQDDASSLQMWASQLGHYTGLLWKTNFDYRKLNGDYLVNLNEFNDYTEELAWNAVQLIREQESRFEDKQSALNVLKALVQFWGAKRS